ncbi:MAG: endonuclease/exonuclease/phosphatase family protein, partial [Gammaproteobacteria bacterium]|nr:endonuclease/exonuclease/phosphatase family protein [Gammaproteobacteria bacterium]
MALVGLYKFSVLAVQETKLGSLSSSEVSINDYTFFRKDRLKTHERPSGGGVGLYIHNSLHPRRLRYRSAPECELILAEICLKRRRLTVGSFYNSAKLNAPTFVQQLSDILSEINLNNKDLVLLGDSNIDCLSAEFNVIEPLLLGFHLQQLVQSPTHLGHGIDNIFCSNSDRIVSSSGIGAPIEKHHCFTWIQLNQCVTVPPMQQFTVRDWEGADWPWAQAFLVMNADGSDKDLVAEILDQTNSVHEAASHLTSELQQAQMKALAQRVKAVRMRRPTCAWMNKPLLRQIQRKQQSYRKFR